MDAYQVIFYRLCRLGFLIYLIDMAVLFARNDISMGRIAVLLFFFLVFNTVLMSIEKKVVCKSNRRVKNMKTGQDKLVSRGNKRKWSIF